MSPDLSRGSARRTSSESAGAVVVLEIAGRGASFSFTSDLKASEDIIHRQIEFTGSFSGLHNNYILPNYSMCNSRILNLELKRGCKLHGRPFQRSKARPAGDGPDLRRWLRSGDCDGLQEPHAGHPGGS